MSRRADAIGYWSGPVPADETERDLDVYFADCNLCGAEEDHPVIDTKARGRYDYEHRLRCAQCGNEWTVDEYTGPEPD